MFGENTEKFLKTYWQIVNTVLFYVVILCTEKNESETEFWLFFRLILQI